jgi:hypothetical protein
MSDAAIIQGSVVQGGQAPIKPGRKLEIEAKLFTTNDQMVPVRLLRGRDLLAGVHIYPIFGMYVVQKKTSVGK